MPLQITGESSSAGQAAGQAGGGTTDHTQLTNIGTKTHAEIDTFIASKGAPNGLCELTATSKIPIARMQEVISSSDLTDDVNLITTAGGKNITTTLTTTQTAFTTDQQLITKKYTDDAYNDQETKISQNTSNISDLTSLSNNYNTKTQNIDAANTDGTKTTINNKIFTTGLPLTNNSDPGSIIYLDNNNEIKKSSATFNNGTVTSGSFVSSSGIFKTTGQTTVYLQNSGSGSLLIKNGVNGTLQLNGNDYNNVNGSKAGQVLQISDTNGTIVPYLPFTYTGADSNNNEIPIFNNSSAQKSLKRSNLYMDPSSLKLSGPVTVQTTQLVRDTNNKGISIGTGTSGNICFTGTSYADTKAGQFLKIDDAKGTIVPITLAASDVVGPTSATDNAIARFDSTTGKLLKNSSVIIGDTNIMSGLAAVTSSEIYSPALYFDGIGKKGVKITNSGGNVQLNGTVYQNAGVLTTDTTGNITTQAPTANEWLYNLNMGTTNTSALYDSTYQAHTTARAFVKKIGNEFLCRLHINYTRSSSTSPGELYISNLGINATTHLFITNQDASDRKYAEMVVENNGGSIKCTYEHDGKKDHSNLIITGEISLTSFNQPPTGWTLVGQNNTEIGLSGDITTNNINVAQKLTLSNATNYPVGQYLKVGTNGEIVPDAGGGGGGGGGSTTSYGSYTIGFQQNGAVTQVPIYVIKSNSVSITIFFPKFPVITSDGTSVVYSPATDQTYLYPFLNNYTSPIIADTNKNCYCQWKEDTATNNWYLYIYPISKSWENASTEFQAFSFTYRAANNTALGGTWGTSYPTNFPTFVTNLVVPTLTSDTSDPNFTLSGDGITDRWRAFDNNATTHTEGGQMFDLTTGLATTAFQFQGVNGPWIKITLNEAKRFNQYSLLPINIAQRTITSWRLLGSNDNSTWTVLDDKNQSIAPNVNSSFNVGTQTWRYIVLHIRSKVGNSPFGIINLYEIDFANV